MLGFAWNLFSASCGDASQRKGLPEVMVHRAKKVDLGLMVCMFFGLGQRTYMLGNMGQSNSGSQSRMIEDIGQESRV